MSNIEIKPLTGGQMDRCHVRLQYDATAIEAAARKSDRLQVAVNRFGNRVFQVDLCFPKVNTAFLDTTTGKVLIHEAVVLANIRNAGNAFAYPLGAPEVRIRFPGLTDSRQVPWSGGLLWVGELTLPDPVQCASPMRDMIRMMLADEDLPLGIPCLWRTGDWNPDCDLIFVAEQVHRMLTDPGDYSPMDAMNVEAALYWAMNRDLLPLKPRYPDCNARGETSEKPDPKSGLR